MFGIKMSNVRVSKSLRSLSCEIFGARNRQSDSAVVSGVRLIEELARKPHVHVAAWKLEDDDVRSTVRGALLQVRHLSIDNIVLMTSHNVTDLLLDMVSAVHLPHTQYQIVEFLAVEKVSISISITQEMPPV